jgi:hypothetical protein
VDEPLKPITIGSKIRKPVLYVVSVLNANARFIRINKPKFYVDLSFTGAKIAEFVLI